MIMINNQWYNIQSMDDIQRIIADEFSIELAGQISEFMPTHTDDEYYQLLNDFEEADSSNCELEDENEYLKSRLEELGYQDDFFNC